MCSGIIVCGLNGCGKSTLGSALAEKLGYHFMDIENFYFDDSVGDTSYLSPRPRGEVERLLSLAVLQHDHFVLAAVKGAYTDVLVKSYKYAILIEVPKEIRMQRIRRRSLCKFGSRVLPGGDLYQAEEDFFNMAEARSEYYVTEWANELQCPVIRVDGTLPIEENVEFILDQMRQ